MSAKVKAVLTGAVVGAAVLTGTGAEATYITQGITEDTTWTAAGNPYILTGQIRVFKGVTLTIEPGVVVLFNKGWNLIIYGKLMAGGPGPPIVFSSNVTPVPGPGDWDRLDFSGDEAAESVLQNCIIRYAGSSYCAISCANMHGPTYPTFTNVTIEDSLNHGMEIRDASPWIGGCTFRRCSGYPIVQYAKASPVYGAPNVFVDNGKDAVAIISGRCYVAWWQNPGIPLEVLGHIDCLEGDVLTIGSGAQLEFHDGGYLWVGGTLKAVGVTFTSIMVGPDRLRFWDCINFRGPTCNDSFLRNCVVEYGGKGGGQAINCQGDSSGQAKPTIVNTTIRDNRRFGIWCANSSPTIRNCTFERNGDYPIVLQPHSSPRYPVPSTFIDNGRDVVALGKGVWRTATWRSPGCPLWLLGNISVPNGEQLTIEPGTRILIWKLGQLYFDGGLTAEGTADRPIVLTSDAEEPEPGDWDGLYFRDGSQPSSLRCCTLQYAGSCGRGAIYCDNYGPPANTSIRDTTIRWSSTHGVVCNNTDPIIAGCTFRRCGKYPIYLRPTSTPRYPQPNTFLQNGRNAVGIEGGTWFSTQWPNIGIPYEVTGSLTLRVGDTLRIDKGNTVQMCPTITMRVNGKLIAKGEPGERIVFRSSRNKPKPGDWNSILLGPDDALSSILQYCTFRHGGFSCQGTVNCCGPWNARTRGPVMENCSILKSTSGLWCNGNCPRLGPLRIVDNEGDGLRLIGLPCRPVVSNSTIMRNKIGVHIMNGAKPNLGNLGNASSADDGGNTIYQNTEYDVRNDSAKPIKAEGNYWGTTSVALIEEHIYDKRDYAPLGRVDFQPFLLTTAGVLEAPGTAQVMSLAVVPTAAGVQVTFVLTAPAEVQARVMNLAGRPVAALCTDRECEAGANRLLWDACADNGLPVPNGTYLIEVTAKTEDGGQARALGQVRVSR